MKTSLVIMAAGIGSRFGERNVLAVDADALFVEIQLQSLIRHDVARLHAFLLLRAAQHGAHPHHHFPDGEWFGDIVVCPQVESRHGVVFRVLRREEDDRYSCRQGVFLESFGEGEARHAAHHHVEQQKVEFLYSLFQCLLGRIRRFHIVTLGFEVELENLTKVLFVVDH